MILVDSSVWIDHFRRKDSQLAKLLSDNQVLIHPVVVGELALGSIPQREITLQLLQDLPVAETATDAEVLAFIERFRLSGLGIGYVDAHLLAAAKLNNAKIWTRDKRLKTAVEKLKLAYEP